MRTSCLKTTLIQTQKEHKDNRRMTNHDQCVESSILLLETTRLLKKDTDQKVWPVFSNEAEMYISIT